MSAQGPITSRMEGLANSVSRDGDWPAGLDKARLYEQTLQDISLGELPPTDILEEKARAARCAGGVAGVREALGRLALGGLVVHRDHVDTVVAPLDIREIEQA